DPGPAVGPPDVVILQPGHAAVGVVMERAGRPERQAGDALVVAAPLDGSDELPERQVPLAAHYEVGAAGTRIRIGAGREARVVAADDDPGGRPEAADEVDDPESGPALEGHDGEADHVRLELGHQPLHGQTHPVLPAAPAG